MIALTLGEIAEIVGGTVADGDAGLARHRTGVPRQPRARARRACSSPSPASTSTGTTSRRGAVEGGAAAVLGSRATGVPTVVVADAQAALQELARRVLLPPAGVRPAEPRPLVAITGSQGKTTAKDMLARVLADAGPTVATAGSFNNELGLPLTVLRATEETRYLVLEMGARGIGHLAELCGIAPPDISLVLNVGKAHIGEFGSQAEHRASPRASSSRRSARDGAAVLNADDPLVAAMADRTHGQRLGLRSYARRPTCASPASSVDDLGRPSFDLTHDGATEHVAAAAGRGAPGHQRRRGTAATALAAGLVARRRWPRACGRSTGSRPGGWRSTSAPTGSWS